MSEIQNNVISVDFTKKDYKPQNHVESTTLTFQFEDGDSFSTDIPKLNDEQWQDFMLQFLQDDGLISLDGLGED